MRRYSKSKIIKAVAVLMLIVIVFLSLGKFHKTTCQSVSITIEDSSEVNFIDKDMVMMMIYKVIPDIVGYKMDDINTYMLDSSLHKCPYIRNVSIYKSISGVLHIDIQQRKPVLMVLGDKQDYYIDSDGMIFATGKDDACQCIVVNGYLKDKYDFSDGKIYKADAVNPKCQTDELFRLAQLIMGDDFWKDLVEQIFVNKDKEYEIVPMIGSFILALGSIEDYDKKMYTLKQFYFKALPKLGWDTYQQISVKFKDQVVCKRKDKK
ncbi:MAG: hypothetical protein II075_10880 [Bacteroidales bacterium]|nr:hypothetical protein [Bacteroidales bacterium]MBQ2096889.1 hypothetical protein [Bacteroidales bacterium]